MRNILFLLSLTVLLTACTGEPNLPDDEANAAVAKYSASAEDLANAFDVDRFMTNEFMESDPRGKYCHDFMDGAQRRISAPLPDGSDLRLDIFAPEGTLRSVELSRSWRSGQEKTLKFNPESGEATLKVGTAPARTVGPEDPDLVQLRSLVDKAMGLDC